MSKQQLVALGIALLIVIWMVFPRSATRTDSSDAPARETTVAALAPDQTAAAEDVGFIVRAARLRASDYVETVRVRGQTEAARVVEVRAEQAGRVVATPVAEGSRVNTGDILCEIAVDTRENDLAEAQSREQQTRVELDAALDLQRQNLASSVSVAQARTAHEAAVAAVARARLALDNTRIRAPFDGIVETRPAEVGALLERGNVCATLMDDDPMLLVGLVPEQQIGKLFTGADVRAELLTGQSLTGTVTYLSRRADPLSRSYRMEAEIHRDASRLLAGITAEIHVAAQVIRAHLIPASALTLDDNGNVGVKTLDTDGMVAFFNVEVVGDETSQVNAGVWVTGLPEQVTLITHGQEIVFPGQQVQVDFSWSDTGP